MIDDDQLSLDERMTLLAQARYSLETFVLDKQLKPLDLQDFTEKLRQPGVTFVTLTIDTNLRGCVGALEAYRPLIEDVREHTIAAASQDYRFNPVQPSELEQISIEISRLTTPIPLHYENPDNLVAQLRPGVDGIVLRDGFRRATFLPQVWKKIPDKVTFLNHLCLKMGAPADFWRNQKLEVLIYQVEEFHE